MVLHLVKWLNWLALMQILERMLTVGNSRWNASSDEYMNVWADEALVWSLNGHIWVCEMKTRYRRKEPWTE